MLILGEIGEFVDEYSAGKVDADFVSEEEFRVVDPTERFSFSDGFLCANSQAVGVSFKLAVRDVRVIK